MNLKNRRIEGVVFDFEGTLVDFQWKLDQAVSETLGALAGMGIDRALFGEYSDYAEIYNLTVDLAEKNSERQDLWEAQRIISKIFDKYDSDALTRWNLYPETIALLHYLKKSGFKTALVTSVGKDALNKAFDKFNLRSYISIVITRNDVVRIKPYPEGLIKAVEIMGTESASTLFVGDSRNDIEAARAAGMPVCYLIGGERWPQNLPKSEADIEITGLREIIPILNID